MRAKTQNGSTTFVGVMVDQALKDLLSQLCEEEGVSISQALRELIQEAVARGYINKTRKELRRKLARR
jgi:antitoxin component of RelBE/YafQ-DinJ toxin-antitoxin module